ncbi:MAG: PAS domain S-box protein, partial [Syntrophales bacterium]
MKKEDGKKSRRSYSQIERIILPEWLFHPGNEEIRRVAFIAYLSGFITFVTIIIFGSLILLQHDAVLGFIDLSFAMVMAGIVLYHRQTKEHDDYFVFSLGVTVYGMFLIYLFFFHELGRATFLWSYTFPLAAFSILGSRRGIIAVILFLIPISLLLILDLSFSSMTSYPRGFAFPLIPSILAVSGMSYLYERNREKNQQQLKLANIALQRSNEEMEQQVQQRTAELARTEGNYRFLTERMSDMVWMTDLNLNVTHVSPSVTRVLGFTPEEYSRLPIHERLTPESLDKAMAILASELEQEKVPATDPERNLQMEIEFCHRDGSTVWVESLMSAIRDDEGNMVGIHGVSRDITKRKRAEETLRESEEKYRYLVKHAPAGIYEVDFTTRKFLSVNDVMCQYGG